MAEQEKKPPFMERIGMRYFQRLSKKYPHNFDPDGIHVLNAEERKGLRRIQRNAVLRAAIAGGISAGLAVLGSVLLEKPLLGDNPEGLAFSEQIGYYAAVMGITIVVTTLEIAFLYRDALRSVHRLSATAGLALFPEEDGEEQDQAAVALALVRAALELPNPPDDLAGVNPRREVSKIRVLVSTLIYKLKATVTNFLIKAIVRRIVGRAGFRTWMEVTAVPVFAAWNAVITWWVMRQARIRAMGPSAVQEYTRIIFDEMGEVGEDAQVEAFRAVGSAIVRTVDLHPNLVALMEALENRFGDPGDIVMDDSALFLEQISTLDANEQEFVLRILALASIIDGKLQRRERILLRKAFEKCGMPPELGDVYRWRKAFLTGDVLEDEIVLGCLPGTLA